MAKSHITDRDRGWKALRQRAAKVGEAWARVGVIGDKASEERGGLTSAELAAVHEFGAPGAGVPQRSFIRRTCDGSNSKIEKSQVVLAEAVIDGKKSVKTALGQLGAIGAGEVKATITGGAGVPPPLAPSTIKRKGSDRPLVDTGRLLGSISWDVEGAE